MFVLFSCLVVTRWERADLLGLWYVMFYYVSVTFPCGVLGQVSCLIVSNPDLAFFLKFLNQEKKHPLPTYIKTNQQI